MTLFVNLKGTLIWGNGETSHVCTLFFPIRNSVLSLTFFCCSLGQVPSVKGRGESIWFSFLFIF